MAAGKREDRVDTAGAQSAGDQVPGAYLVSRGSVDAHGRSIITPMVDTDVLIAGAGPVGLTAAIELARRGVDFRIVDPITDPPQYAKAVGVQPRTLEVFEGMGVLNRILDAAIQMFGQTGVRQRREGRPGRVRHAGRRPVRIHRNPAVRHRADSSRGTRHARRAGRVGYSDRRLRAGRRRCDRDLGRRWRSADGARTLSRRRRRRAQHRAERLGPDIRGCGFRGAVHARRCRGRLVGAAGWAVRSMHQTDGTTDDLLVCIPLPGRGRYRMSMLVPEDLTGGSAAGDGIAHGFEGSRKPTRTAAAACSWQAMPRTSTLRRARRA